MEGNHGVGGQTENIFSLRSLTGPALICCRINTVTGKIVNKTSSEESLPTETWQT